MSYGLLSFGHELGDRVPVAEAAPEYTRDLARVAEYGTRYLHRCPDGVGLTDLSYAAARKALDAAEVSGDEIDLLVLAITDIPEYLYWDAAAALLHRLGADGAEAVLLTQACSAGVAAFDLVAGKFATHPEYRTAVVVAANRVAEPYWNRMETGAGIFSDGAAATVARRGHDTLRWLAGDITTDGEYVDFFRMDAGGAVAPFGSPAAVEAAAQVSGIAGTKAFFAGDEARISAFVEQVRGQYRRVLEGACKRAGVDLDSLTRLHLPFDNGPAMAALAEFLDVPPERTNMAHGNDFGHFGAADPIFSLGIDAAGGALHPGDRVALAAIGRGHSWACALFEV